MGVTGLWQVLSPCARPIKLETLNKKRLAVDASIWIYQFLKAVRDKEGNALRNSHVVGFFRRICKLLFFGIKPVFVFDGGAPALKRATISGRKRRREGRREDAVRTAGKLLAVQMQRLAEEEDRKRREERDGLRSGHEEQTEEALPDNLVYVDELQMTPQERQQTRRFKKKDAYHLPELDVSLSEMGAPNDPRIMSQEELEEYARQFNSGEDINLYDFSKIDFNSPFFLSLPASDRYNILNAARLRSRLRMGYSKDQLDTMFPDRMAFSRFQIERVKERNELTQRLMNINGMNGEDAMFGLDNGGRVAGEKGREYILVKNDGVEGGWALGVVGGKDEGKRNQPINVDEYLPPSDVQESGQDDYEWEDVEEGFEDVPIEGLNRLPKRTNSDLRPTFGSNEDEILRKRNAFYKSRRQPAVSRMSGKKPKGTTESESLFVEDDQSAPLLPEEIEDDLFQDLNEESLTEKEQLSRAIALSLEQPFDFDTPDDGVKETDDGSHKLNETEAPNILENDSDDEDEIDFQAALAEARRSKHHSQAAPRPRSRSRSKSPSRKIATTEAHGSSKNLFSGPLPFEKLEFRGFTPKHPEKSAGGGEAGGFIRDASEKEMKKKKAEPLPPWFEAHGHLAKDLYDNSVGEEVQFDGGNPERLIRKREDGLLNGSNANEVVDVDAPPNAKNLPDIIPVDSTDSDEGDMEMEDVPLVNEPGPMNDVADLVRTEPPNSAIPESTQVDQISPPNHDLAENSEEEIYDWEESDHEKDQLSNNVSEPQTRQDGPLSTRLLDQNLQHAPRPTPRQLDAHEDASIITDGNITDLPHSMHPGGYDIEAPEQDEYSDPEDEDLMQQLATEAEEHARFAATLNSNTHIQSAQDYEKELRQLRNQQKKDRRDADEVTHIMVTECQQLLKLFGLPYITAPMEAEAQCAELVSLGLVDGIVTDDSDTFLFGGTRVYKNMFNQAKFVECYLASDLEKEFDLDRNKLIRLAHLLGSDYTDGIPLVGPVTALEILSEFSSERGLEDFKEWWTSVQMGQKAGPEESAFRKKFRRNATKIFLPPTFPDPRVQEAYRHPEVDSDPSDFAWGVPDLDALRQFLMATIGWTQDRTDEVLVPVIKDMNRRDLEGTQANITNFFGGGIGAGAFAPRKRKEGKSRRMENALGRLQAQAVARRQTEHCDGSDHDDQNAESDSPRVAADREHTPVPGKRRAARDNSSEIHSGEERSSAPEAPPKKPKPGRSSRARKRRK